jgi:hypothetical protein
LANCYWNCALLAREQHDSKTEREKFEQALPIYTELASKDLLRTLFQGH